MRRRSDRDRNRQRAWGAKMNEHKREPAESPEALRRRAEQQLDLETLSGNDLSEVDAAAVIHELRVHQIELQTQNQELREARHELEQSRTQYAELFDFAPNGYLVFDANGLVVQANLTAAAMLGWERSILLGRPFSLYVAPAGRDTWRSHYGTVFKTGKSQQCELELVGRGETRLTVRLVSRPVIEAGDQVVQCRTAMLDVTASYMLGEMDDLLHQRNVVFRLANCTGEVRDMLRATYPPERVGHITAGTTVNNIIDGWIERESRNDEGSAAQ